LVTLILSILVVLLPPPPPPDQPEALTGLAVIATRLSPSPAAKTIFAVLLICCFILCLFWVVDFSEFSFAA
jgi:hypothetical protein